MNVRRLWRAKGEEKRELFTLEATSETFSHARSRTTGADSRSRLGSAVAADKKDEEEKEEENPEFFFAWRDE